MTRRYLDLSAPATDDAVIGYVRMPVYAYESVADPHDETVEISGDLADAMTDGALIKEMRQALRDMTERYVSLVLSGDAGHWNPEDEAPVIFARAALAKARACGHG